MHILGLLVNEEPVTDRTENSHQFLVENCLACFGRVPGPDDHALGKVNLVWIRRCRDTEPCDTQESIERYIQAHIFYMLGTVVFSDKLTNFLNSKCHRLSRTKFYSDISPSSATFAYNMRTTVSRSRQIKEIVVIMLINNHEIPIFVYDEGKPIPHKLIGNCTRSIPQRLMDQAIFVW
ncbi:hypothetical protein AHAS_Ahas07G0142100 [Arachis hypogaea]